MNATLRTPEARATRLDRLLSSIDRQKVAGLAAEMPGIAEDAAELRAYLDTYLNEARVGLELAAPHLENTSRILEIGSGIGVLTQFLAAEGFEITGLEPGAAAGFGFMSALGTVIGQELDLAVSAPEILPIGAEKLSPEIHGQFDLIFSVNVVEHILPLDQAMQSLASVLAPDGVMIHLCPNYAFPYEPHLGIPLLPVIPEQTRHLRPGLIQRHQRIWDSVNFVTAGRITRLSQSTGLKTNFRRGVMAAFMDRLQSDPIFRDRQPKLIAGLTRIPGVVSGLAALMRLIPPGLATPMVFTQTHASSRH
ncbi:MAG: class I SAM-dependent methyltransferase [Pseudomonadota bacterium]